MSDGNWKAILVTGLGSAFGTFVVWLGGFGPKLLEYSIFAFDLIANFVNHQILVPVWALLIVLFLLACGIKTYKNKIKKQAIESTETEPRLNFKPNEELIIEILAREDGGYLGISDISHGLGKSNLHVEQALDELLKKDFLFNRYNYLDGRTFRLSDRGRDYAIEKKYV